MSTQTKTQPVESKPAVVAEKPKPVYTTKEETARYLIIAEKKMQFMRKEGNPERTICIPSQVTPMIVGTSIDRGEYVDRFFVSQFTMLGDKLVPHQGPEASFYMPCKEFLEKYKHAE